MMAVEVRFSMLKAGGDRVHHVREEDVRVVLGRLPEEVRRRLRGVHFNDRSSGGRRLGYVNRGRQEIALCALPPRISFTRALVRGQKPGEFGARRGAQWPAVAIRRFMLYDVFLHELGHLQVVNERAKGVRRKFAMETKAQEFGMYWCRRLWAERFEHPDPAHRPPTAEEMADVDPELTDMRVRAGQFPEDAGLSQRLGSLYFKRKMMTEAKVAYDRALALDPDDGWTVLFLGNWHFSRRNTAAAIQYFQRGTALLPMVSSAYWCLAEAYEMAGDLAAADANYRKAVLVEPRNVDARKKLKAWEDQVKEQADA